MTSSSSTTALLFGCGIIAFSLNLSLLFFFAHKKAQLIIIVTSSAFAFLLSSLVSSLFWLPFRNSNNDLYFYLFVPLSVLIQELFRIIFVKQYHRVEAAVADSIHRHEEELNDTRLTETTLLRLELNDWACGLAAGVGFGGMHSLMLYGTLLASQVMDDGSKGTLYQDSCSFVPSLVNSAFIAFFFSILDIFYMFFTFFGVRRRSMLDTTTGNMALCFVVVSHLVASISTFANRTYNGCLISIPSLFLVVVVTALIFTKRVAPCYLPEDQKRRTVSCAPRTSPDDADVLLTPLQEQGNS